MSRTIELSDEIYGDLERAAREVGLTPAGWIASALASASGQADGRLLPELLEGLIGAVDSTNLVQSGSGGTPYSELIAKKFERQGLRRP